MAAPPSLTELLKHFHDPNVNPFQLILHEIDLKKNPPVDEAQSLGLLLSIATYNVIFLVCVAIICLPYLQGAGISNRRHWIIKRQYLDGHRQPYWIPNSGLIVAVSHLVGSTLFLVFLGLRYSIFKTGVAVQSFYGSAWLEMRWFPSYCAFFTQAWSTWFVRASDATLKGKRSRMHPVAFNINLLGLPLTALVLALVLISAQVAAMNAADESYNSLVGSLTAISRQWHPGQHPVSERPAFLAASADYAHYRLASSKLIARFRKTGIFWTLMAVPTLIFYIFGISTLLRVMYKRFQAVKGQSDSDIASTTSSIDSFRKRLRNGHHQNKSNQLRTSFIYLGVHYTMMSITLFYHIIIGLVFYLSDDTAMLNDKFLGLFMVLSNSGSYLLLAALLVQLTRIIVEGKQQAKAAGWKGGQNADFETSTVELIKRSSPDIKLMT